MTLISKNLNRIIAILAAVLLSAIVFSGAATGIAGIFFLVLAAVFLIAGFASPCSLNKSCESGACKIED